MEKYFNNVLDRNGKPIKQARVDVLGQDGLPAQIYLDNNGTIQTQPLYTDALGYFSFYAADGHYNLTITNAGDLPVVITDVLLEDPTGDMRNARNHGAKGDGIADDTAAMTKFLTYLKNNGGRGWIPAGTYNISFISIDLAGNKAFTIEGDGIGATVLKCTAPTFNFLTLQNCRKVTLRQFTVDNGYQVGQSQANGGGLILVNANDCKVQHVAVINPVRVGFMAYNDHQTTLANVYSGLTYDHCYVDGGAAYVESASPSAFIIADYNNSRITNSHIKNIGLYGYEFKNDSSNCFILDSIAENVFYPIYFGGDGAHVELGYVKHSLVDNILIYGGTSPIFIGQASYNTIRNVRINNTGRAGQMYTVAARNNSNYNTISGIEIVGRDVGFLFDLRATANNNLIEFSNIIDAGSTQTGGAFDNTCTGNRVMFGARDSTHKLIPATIYSNTIIDLALNTEHLNIAGSTLKKIKLGDVGADSLFSTSKGFAVLGDTVDVFYQTKQDFQYQHTGNFTKPDVFSDRKQLSTGERRFYETVNGTITYVALNPATFAPGVDLQKSLGLAGFRWNAAHVQKLYLYPAAADVPTVNGQLSIEATSNTQLALRLKGSDGTVRSVTLTLA